MRGTLPFAALAIGACAEETVPSPASVCDVLQDGIWLASGPGVGMTMHVMVTFDPEGCTFQFSQWDMYHEGWPVGGWVDHDSVQLALGAYWESCMGVLDAEGANIIGECSASVNPNGGAFSFVWDPEP